MKCTKVFSRTLDAYTNDKYRIISNVGSTRSSKTFSVLQLLYLIAVKNKKHISVVSVNMPHLKRGCLKDFNIIMDGENRSGLQEENKSDKKFIFSSGSIVEFFSVDNAAKLRGSQRDILFVNECNLISAECYRQLAIRTSEKILLDYNPTNEFWIEDLRDRNDFIEFHSTYKDNNFLTADQIREIESNKNNESWWRVYGLGLCGSNEGMVYPKFDYVPDFDIPHGKVIWGLDFGYNDPTALVKVTELGKDLYIQEKLYKTKLSADDILQAIKEKVAPNDTIIADNARPEIIAFLKKNGVKIKPCIKGKNSIRDGIQIINNYYIHVTGKNLHREIQNYKYEKNEMTDEFYDVPEDKNNHALDAMRYAVTFNKNNSYNIKII